MIYPKELFDLQIGFAERVCAISGMPLERALLEYTNLYKRLGLGRGFDRENETWRVYIDGARRAPDLSEWTYAFYMNDPEARTAPATVATCGCFSYAVQDDGVMRIHFLDVEPAGTSPLGIARAGERRRELAAIVAHASTTIPDTALVMGFSWLYNLDAYRRLFPASYIASRTVVPGCYRSMPLWGQFVDHRGGIKREMAERFLGSLARTYSLERLDACFPLQVLTAGAPLRDFVEHYRAVGPISSGSVATPRDPAEASPPFDP